MSSFGSCPSDRPALSHSCSPISSSALRGTCCTGSVRRKHLVQSLGYFFRVGCECCVDLCVLLLEDFFQVGLLEFFQRVENLVESIFVLRVGQETGGICSLNTCSLLEHLINARLQFGQDLK